MKKKSLMSVMMLFLLAASLLFRQDVYAIGEMEIKSGKEYKERLTPENKRTLEYVLKVDKSGYQYLTFKYKENEVNKLKDGFIITLRDKDKKQIHRLETTKHSAKTPTVGVKKGDQLYITIEVDFAFLDPVNGAEISFILHTKKDKTYEAENNNTPETANRIDNNVGKTGNLHVAGDEDWFAYKIPSNGTTDVTLTVDTYSKRDRGNGYKLEIFDENKTLLKSVSDIMRYEGISKLSFKKGSILYFKISASDFSHVPDKVNYTIVPTSERDKFSENEPNDSMKKATKLEKKISGYLIDEADEDYFVFKANKTKKYTVKLETGDLAGKKYSFSIYVKKGGKTKKKAEKVVSENKALNVSLKKNEKLWIKVKGMQVDVPVLNNYTITVK